MSGSLPGNPSGEYRCYVNWLRRAGTTAVTGKTRVIYHGEVARGRGAVVTTSAISLGKALGHRVTSDITPRVLPPFQGDMKARYCRSVHTFPNTTWPLFGSALVRRDWFESSGLSGRVWATPIEWAFLFDEAQPGSRHVTESWKLRQWEVYGWKFVDNALARAALSNAPEYLELLFPAEDELIPPPSGPARLIEVREDANTPWRSLTDELLASNLEIERWGGLYHYSLPIIASWLVDYLRPESLRQLFPSILEARIRANT
jgi:hypothetical protein